MNILRDFDNRTEPNARRIAVLPPAGFERSIADVGPTAIPK